MMISCGTVMMFPTLSFLRDPLGIGLSSHLTPLCLTSALPDWSVSAPLCTHPHTSFSSEIFSRSFPSPTTLFVTETRVHPGGICHRCGPHWNLEGLERDVQEVD